MEVHVIVLLFISVVVASSLATPPPSSPPNIKTTTSTPPAPSHSPTTTISHLDLSFPINNVTSHDLSFPFDIEDDRTSIALNQLVLISILNKIQDISLQQSPEEVAELRTEVRLLREEGRQNQQSMKTALETIITMQGLVIEMQQEQQHHKIQLATINTTIVLQHEQGQEIKREVEQHQVDIEALNTTSIEHGVGAVEAHAEVVEQCRSESQAASDTLSTQIRQLDHRLDTFGQEIKREVEQHQIDIEALNTTSIEHGSDIDEYKEEVTVLKNNVAYAAKCHDEGAFLINYDCSISVCQGGYKQPYQGSLAPNVSFTDLLAKDCVHLERTKKTWDAARADCMDIGGDFFVAGDLKGARQYVGEQQNIQSLGKWPWVGARARQWLDGRPVAAGEWFSGAPDDDPDVCDFLSKNGVGDASCSINMLTSLCVKGQSYQ